MWIEGFLAGAEPDAKDVLGPYFDGDLDSDDMKRWRKVVEEFRAKGTWIPPIYA